VRRAAGEKGQLDPDLNRGLDRALRQLLVYFQGTGEFRAGFDPAVMAMAIRSALDAVPARLARDPDLDLGHYGRELADLYHLATRPEGSHPGAATHEQSAEDL
jgi:hypothetical protein